MTMAVEGSSSSSSFYVETASDSLNDLHLQVVPLENEGSPRWLRRRVLGSKEIVDELLDVRSGQIRWTAHRPVDGWYLRVRSPLLPQNAFVELKRPSRRSVKCEIGSRPLSMQIPTRLNKEALSGRSSVPAYNHTRSASNPFTSINLDHAVAHDEVSDEDGGQQPSRSTGVQSKSHARRRSSGLANKVAHTSRRSVSSSNNANSTPVIAESTWEGSSAAQNVDATSTPCTIVLCDGTVDLAGSPTACTPAAQPPSWARWAWKALPSFVRPELSLDASNSFSIWWTDAQTSGNQPGLVEVARFVDVESTSWSWTNKRKGVLTIQHDALRALNVDIAMWIALSLAYLEYLNERKGFDAACDA